ncbi:N-acetylglucosamine kinase [Microbacterium sp. P5_E9]
MTGTLAVDIGQTGLRLRVADGDVVESPVGVNALTGDAQVQALAARIADQLPSTASFDAIGIGLSGYVEGSPAPAALAAEVHKRLQPRLTVVAADAVTAFLGTVGPHPGTVAICGTGVAALGVGSSGLPRRIDARGYLLGDFGSGFWLGQHGLQAALDAIEGRGEFTALARASMRLGTPEDIYHDAMSSTPPPRYVAGFAPDVLRAAEDGDEVAQRILEEAADQLALTIRSARVDDGPIGLTGGLTRSETFVSAVYRALDHLGLHPAPFIVRSDAALDGARVVAEEPDIRPAFAGLIAIEESE